MRVPVEMQVEVFHRYHLGVACTGRSALHPKYGPDRRFARAVAGVPAGTAQPLGEGHRRRRLTLAGLGRGHPGDVDQLAVRLVAEALEHRQVDLALVPAVLVDLLRLEPDPFGDLRDRTQLGILCDLKAAFHLNSSPSRKAGWELLLCLDRRSSTPLCPAKPIRPVRSRGGPEFRGRRPSAVAIAERQQRRGAGCQRDRVGATPWGHGQGLWCGEGAVRTGREALAAKRDVGGSAGAGSQQPLH